MVVDRLEHLLRRNQQRGHLPDGHLKVHLWEFKQPNQSASLPVSPYTLFTSPIPSPLYPHLLKKRGIRILDPPLAGVDPNVDGPAC